MSEITIKLNGRRKIKYEAKLIPSEYGIILDAEDEQMFVPYGSLEYAIAKKEVKNKCQ